MVSQGFSNHFKLLFSVPAISDTENNAEEYLRRNPTAKVPSIRGHGGGGIGIPSPKDRMQIIDPAQEQDKSVMCQHVTGKEEFPSHSQAW